MVPVEVARLALVVDEEAAAAGSADLADGCQRRDARRPGVAHLGQQVGAALQAAADVDAGQTCVAAQLAMLRARQQPGVTQPRPAQRHRVQTARDDLVCALFGQRRQADVVAGQLRAGIVQVQDGAARPQGPRRGLDARDVAGEMRAPLRAVVAADLQQAAWRQRVALRRERAVLVAQCDFGVTGQRDAVMWPLHAAPPADAENCLADVLVRPVGAAIVVKVDVNAPADAHGVTSSSQRWRKAQPCQSPPPWAKTPGSTRTCAASSNAPPRVTSAPRVTK